MLLGFSRKHKTNSDQAKNKTVEAEQKEIKHFDYNEIEEVLRHVIDLYNEIWSKNGLYESNLTKSKFHLERLNDTYPNESIILTNLGAIHLELGEPQKALIYLKKAESIDSSDRNLLMNIGIAMMNLESERPRAKLYFKLASNKSPNKLTIQAYFDPQAH